MILFWESATKETERRIRHKRDASYNVSKSVDDESHFLNAKRFIAWLVCLSMYELIRTIREFQEAPTDENFTRIIGILNGRRIREMSRVPSSFREDNSQEWLIRLFLLIKKFRILPCTMETDLFFERIWISFNRKEISLFEKWIVKKGESALKEACANPRDAKKLIDEFTLFSNEIRFLHLLKRSSDFLYIDFLRKMNRRAEIELTEVKEIEFERRNPCDFTFLEEKDRQFLFLFLGEDCLLSEREVAEKLGISQQAVHKRKARIVKKHRKQSIKQE